MIKRFKPARGLPLLAPAVAGVIAAGYCPNDGDVSI